MMSNLPQGWASVPLKDIATVFLGKTPARSEYCSKGKYKVIKFRDLKSGLVDFSNAKDGYVMDKTEIVSSLRLLQEKDVLITSAAHSGENIGKKCAYIKRIPDQFEGVFFTGELLNIRAEYDETLAKWSYLYFLSAKGFKEIQSAVKGVHLTSGRANMMQIDIAPLNEQRRIVAKLEKLLQKVDACKDRLDKIPTILKHFRQSILAAACSGRLSADWREKHPDVEPATELLKQIQEERKEKRLRNPQVLQIDMDELPDTWVKTKISDVYDINPGHKGIEIDENLEVSFIPMKLIEEETGFMDASSVKGYKEVKRGYTKFIEDDVVFAKITPCMENGKIAIAKNLCNGIGCGTTELHVFRPVEKDTNNFLFYFLLQKEIREMAKNRFQGTSGHLRVPVDFFEEIGFPLPPLEEQQEIVRRVEALFKVADQIQERYNKARTYVDKLTQSILAKAFCGELVLKGTDDEPASKLLKRIQEEKDRQIKKREKKVKK